MKISQAEDQLVTDFAVRQKNGSYKISRNFAETQGLDPEITYKSKSDCIAALRELSPLVFSQPLRPPGAESFAFGSRNFLFGLLSTFAVSVFLTMSYFSEMLNGNLGLIDDHEYLQFLGDDREISWAEVPSLLASTEAGSWGEGTRFRPMYFLLRILQTKLFGLDGALWFGSRLVIFTLTVTLICFTVWRVVDHILRHRVLPVMEKLGFQLVSSIAVAVLTASMASWSDIMTRLGPSEIYVAFGFALMSYGLTHSGLATKPYFGWLVASAGVILAITTKENGILLLAPLVTIVLMQMRNRQGVVLGFGALALPMSFGLWVLAGVSLGMGKSGGDVYGEQRSLGGFFVALLANPYFWITVLAALAVIALEVVKVRDEKSVEVTSGNVVWLEGIRRYPMSVLALLVLIQLSGESYFYQNSLGQGVFSPARYGIGSELAVLSIAAIAIALSISLYRAGGTLGKLPMRIAAGALGLGVVLASVAPVSRAATEFRELSLGTVQYLSYQMEIMEQASDYLREFEQAQVLLLVDEPYDYERVMSLPLFVENLADRDTSFFVNTQIPKELEADSLQADLSKRLLEMSATGFQDGPWQISPLGELELNSEVLCFYFGQEVSSPNCSQTIGIG